MRKRALIIGLVLLGGLLATSVAFYFSASATPATPTGQSKAATALPTSQSQPQNCVGQALTKDAPAGATPQVNCYDNEAAAIKGALGTAWISTHPDGIKSSFASQFPGLPPLTFVDAQKQHCAAMIVDAGTHLVKAQCFDTQQEAETAANSWRDGITSH